MYEHKTDKSLLPFECFRNSSLESPFFVRLIPRENDLPIVHPRLGGLRLSGTHVQNLFLTEYGRGDKEAVWRISGNVNSLALTVLAVDGKPKYVTYTARERVDRGAAGSARRNRVIRLVHEIISPDHSDEPLLMLVLCINNLETEIVGHPAGVALNALTRWIQRNRNARRSDDE
ncbi:hypothetical protein CAOG_008120 [Capsaspora owczarzaki ATCC 30864]|uniref:Uncharacterized protein n=2 Tax=Capsaspora owczarzaki (strain ATCC 30864) TaxID=595528 RepID=A0A0D2UT28_CAPO3|nr:hypothetical protein CAOG_008120 [Capsaspora owczarzaki ATCC 30864]